MVHLAGIKSGEISNSRGSLKAAGLSKSRGHPLGVSQGRKLLDFTRGFCDAARGAEAGFSDCQRAEDENLMTNPTFQGAWGSLGNGNPSFEKIPPLHCAAHRLSKAVHA